MEKYKETQALESLLTKFGAYRALVAQLPDSTPVSVICMPEEIRDLAFFLERLQRQ